MDALELCNSLRMEFEGVYENKIPLDALPAKLQDMVLALARQENYSIEYTLASLLVAASTAIGNAVNICIRGGWISNAAMYMILVGRPGMGKTPPLDFAFRPIRKHDAKAIRKFKDEMEHYNEALERQRGKKEDSGTLPPKPILRRTIISDFTPEALIRAHDDNKRGVVLYVDEIMGMFNAVNQYSKGQLIEQLLTAFSGNQYYKSYQDNISDVDSVFQASNLERPQFIHTNKIKYQQNKQLNLYKDTSVDITDVWNDIICSALKLKNSDLYIGETYFFGKSGTSSQCVYFDTKNPDITLQESEGLLFISKDLKTKISIAGPFEYMNNGNKITLPYQNHEFTKYSFLPNSITPDILEKLRQKGNLVFYENY